MYIAHFVHFSPSTLRWTFWRHFSEKVEFPEIIDEKTLEVTLSDNKNLYGLFNELNQKGVTVLSIKNKTNRISPTLNCYSSILEAGRTAYFNFNPWLKFFYHL